MRNPRGPGHVARMGIFGGSFDPIHLGHLILAQASLEELELDRILFIPAGVSPFKTGRPPAVAPGERLEMIRRAIVGEPRFSVDERELEWEGPSFAINTVRSLLLDYPGVRFVYLIGADNLRDLEKWHQIDELMALVDFAVLNRGEQKKALANRFPLVRRRVDLSSSEIRNRIHQGLSIRFMVPQGVYDIVMTRHLYRSPDGEI